MDKTVYETIIEALVDKLRTSEYYNNYLKEEKESTEKQLKKLQGEYKELKKKYDDLTF